MQALFKDRPYHLPMTKGVSRLRELRERAGLTLRELARQIDEDHSNVGFWERTGKIPRSDVLIPIAKALGVSVEQLLGDERPKRVMTPGGRMRQLFDAASKLPRSQQEKIMAILEPFVTVHSNGQNKAA